MPRLDEAEPSDGGFRKRAPFGIVRKGVSIKVAYGPAEPSEFAFLANVSADFGLTHARNQSGQVAII